jgi:hypothetical protein
MTSNAAHSDTATRASNPARSAFLAFAFLAAMVWVGIAVGANVRAPGVVGIAAAVFGGLSAAVLTLTIGGWIALKLAETPPVLTASAGVTGSEPSVLPALTELEAAQRPILRRMVERSSWRTPLFAAAAVAGWCILVMLGASGGVFDFSIILLGGGLAGYGWTHRETAKELSAVYLERGVNTLAGTQGDLVWRKATPIDLPRLRSERVLTGAAELSSTGEIAGTLHGAMVRIAPIRTKPVPDQTASTAGAFTGLLIELDAPHLSATSMEDVATAYPRLAIRISQLSAMRGLGPPVSAASGSRVSIAIPETSRPRVFDPPSSADARAATARLSRIREVIAAANGFAEAIARPV